MSEDTRYGFPSAFCVRLAGVPYEPLDTLGTPGVAAAARALVAAEAELVVVGEQAVMKAAELGKDERAFRKVLKRSVNSRRTISDEHLAQYPWLEPYQQAARALERATANLDGVFTAEAARVHRDVRRLALELLPDFSVLESDAMVRLLDELAAERGADTSGPTRRDDRQDDRSLAMYLQRVCTKADTISRFGPTAWGTIRDDISGLSIAPAPGIAKRHVEVERWVVTGLIEAINNDPLTRIEVSPRVHPAVVLEARDDLSASDRAVLARCDGRTPAHVLGDLAALERLAAAGVIIWELERFAVDGSPLASLDADITAWRPGAAQERWLPRVRALGNLARRFGETDEPAARRRVFADVRSLLADVGVAEKERGRTLYSAANPLVENCYREAHFALGRDVVDRTIADASPWFDLFRDAFALASMRAFDVYRPLVAEAPRSEGRVTYAALVKSAKSRGIEIDNDKLLLKVARETWGEVKTLFSEGLAGRDDAEEWRLTAHDCHVLRRRFSLPSVEELSYPQVDLQIAAASPQDVAAGNYRALIAEQHHAIVPTQQSTFWSCPDKPGVQQALAAALAGRPYAVRGALTEQPVHISGEAVFGLPGVTYVGGGRAKPAWRTARPHDIEVVVDDQARDIRLRDSRSGADLGSIVRGFRIMMGMHPFFPFDGRPHAPRLVIGNTVVQRQHWYVSTTELERGGDGATPEFVVAIERLRRDRKIPRWVFARVSATNLKAFDVYERDKDVKPFFVDLESTLFLDILERRFKKYGELVFSEMLPSPDELVWPAADGRRVFEIRTSLMPVVSSRAGDDS